MTPIESKLRRRVIPHFLHHLRLSLTIILCLKYRPLFVSQRSRLTRQVQLSGSMANVNDTLVANLIIRCSKLVCLTLVIISSLV
jgi:hypothetical protein